ncbi:MAG: hypothetical protein IJE04_02350 [Bacilli bacterium]|nr:hypothetical protein [Bacilli bacterium]
MENNNGINIFGYSYDNKQNKYVVNEDQAKVVKTIYELYNKYYLNLDEIEELIKGNIDIDYIIASRIERIYEELKEQQLESKNPFDKLNIANLLKCAYGLREHLINHFTELKKKIEYIDNMNDEIDVEGILNDIEDVLTLLNDRYALNTKYKNFEETKKIIDEYRQQAKGIIVDNDYKELIEKSKDIDKFYSYSQSSIISEDLYKEVLETINNRNLTNEEIEK